MLHILGVIGEELVCWEPPGSSESPTGHFVISQSHLPPNWNFRGVSETLFEHNCFSVALAVGHEAWFEVTPGPILCCLFTCGHCSTSPLVGSTPKHRGGVKFSWIIELGNGFEAKGHLKQRRSVVGVITWGKDHLGGWGGWWLCCGFSPCGLPPAKLHCTDTQDTLLFPLGKSRCLGWGHTGGLRPFWSRREPGIWGECRVSVVVIELRSALGLPTGVDLPLTL